MEKKAVIEEGLTPPDTRSEQRPERAKQASDEHPLEDHLTKRLKDAAERKSIRKCTGK